MTIGEEFGTVYICFRGFWNYREGNSPEGDIKKVIPEGDIKKVKVQYPRAATQMT